MSEVPELRELVRGVAERRARRRHVWRPLPPLALAAAIAAALVFALPRGDDSREIEVPAVTASPTTSPPAAVTLADSRAALASAYGVFRRPMRESDKPRRQSLGRNTHAAPLKIDWAHARRIAVLGDHEQFAVPALYAGQVALCVIGQLSDGSPRSEGCGPFDPERQVWGKQSLNDGMLYFLLLPDGVDHVAVHLKSGKVFRRPVTDNGVLWQTRGFREVTWVDASGQSHRTRMSI